MEVELMVTKGDDRPIDRVNIEQSASGKFERQSFAIHHFAQIRQFAQIQHSTVT